MKTDRTQKGQALILIVFAVIGLLALTGLAVDGSVTYSNRQSAQNAAETAALTGALDLANSVSSTTTIANDEKHAATADGFTDDSGVTTTVIAEPPGTFVAGCNGQTPSFANASQYVQVIINTNVNTSFSSLIGVKQMHNCVDAIARGQSGSTGAMFNGAAIVATGGGSSCTDINLNGNATINTYIGGIFDNCASNSALTINANSKITGPSPIQVVGNATYNSCPQSTCAPEGVTTGVTPALVMPAAAWATIPAPPAAPTCSGSPGTVTPSSDLSGSTVTVPANSSATISGGTYSGLLLNGNATLNMNSGNYCLTGSLGLNSGNDVVNGSGTVNLSIGDNNLDFGSNTTNTFSDFEIWAHNGGFTVNNNAVLKANTKFRFYSTGSSAFLIDANSGITSPDAFIYLTSGPLTMNANSSITLTAPTTGSYAGLAIYMPWSTNTSQVTLDSNSAASVTGTILAPNCPIEINANGTANIYSQLIGSTVRVEANSVLNVTFNAGQNYGTPTTAIVELIK